jgi:DNA-binding transcriptional regulator GbsR (MarR family)
MEPEAHPQILEVAESIGEFIEYWGFKKIHGRIWAMIFLAEDPVDASYLTKELQVSKALVSMSLKDLLHYKVILTTADKKSTTRYISNPNLTEVILDVLMNREAKLLLSIKASCEILNRIESEKLTPHASPQKARKLKKMVTSADRVLKACLTLKQINFKDMLQPLNSALKQDNACDPQTTKFNKK